MTKVCIMAAISSYDRGIGKDGKLLWHIGGDLEYFKKTTMGHPIIMGRKTYESIGKPLPGRINIIVTKNNDFHPEGTIVSNSVEEAIDRGKRLDDQEIFIIGGGQIYKQAMPLADKLYLTLVHAQKEADTFFPEYNMFEKLTFKEERSEDGIKYTFLELEAI